MAATGSECQSQNIHLSESGGVSVFPATFTTSQDIP